ncbi:MAG: transposase, partial [Planctomycetota bacterium]
MFEAFAVRVLLSAANVKRATELLGLSWDAAHRIMQAAVKRGLKRRETEDVKHVGVDEKSFGRGHDYVSILTDTDGARVLEVVPERTIEPCDKFRKTLAKTQLGQIESVSMDMWQAFISSAAVNVPEAKIVHDKFHIAKYLGEAV